MLEELARKHGTDKAGHGYMPHYERHFEKFRNETFNLLEIGVHKGASLRMWKEYFPNAQIHGIDKNPAAKEFEEDRIYIQIGDQANIQFLNCAGANPSFEIIIDDGSHKWEHQIKSFQTLFPVLADGGLYVIEDLHTSYHKEFGNFISGNMLTVLDNIPKRTTEYLSGLVDDMNTHGYNYGNKERIVSPTYYEDHIAGMHFYKSICFIEKK